MSVRVQLSVSAVCGGGPAAPPPALTLRGSQVHVVLAGVAGNAASAVETWRSRAPQAELAKRIELPAAQLAAAGVGSCEALGRFAFSQAFGVDASSFKLFGLLRCSMMSAQQLSRWLAVGEKVAIEPAGGGGGGAVGGGALDAASDELEIVFYFLAHEMVGAWRSAVGTAYDSCLLGGQAADARFSPKVFAKLLGGTEAKVDAALGRQHAAAAVSEDAPPELETVSLDVVLLREVEAKLTQLRAGGFSTLSAEIDAVLASKKRAPAAAAVAENATPNAGVPPRPPPAHSSRCPRALAQPRPRPHRNPRSL
jgi:hypothetical protein